jgi:serine/threonine protein kinase
MSFEYRNNINEKLNLKNLNICKNLINQNKTEFLNKGYQGEVFKAMSNDCGCVVVKKLKLINEKDKRKINKLKEEYKIMLLTNRMIDNFICPNFIKVYDYNNSVPLIIMEYADGDCKFLFKDEYYDTEIYISFLFQVLMSIYCFNNYTMLYHRDVKLGNILYKKINKNIVFHYKIENKDYYIPTCGYLFMLCDFGIAKLKLNGRSLDIINLDYKIIKNYILDFSKKYLDAFNNNKNIDNIIEIIRSSKEISQNNSFNKNMTDVIDIIKNIKNKKINKFVFDIHDILTFDLDICKIFNKYFTDYTKNNYNKENIIHFIVEF